MSSTYALLADLPVEIEARVTERHERETSSGFVRVTTEIVLIGKGHEGRGEDVWTEAEEHGDYTSDVLPDLSGSWTIGELGERLRAHDMFPHDRAPANGPLFRRWGFEAAALDLALRQAGVSLADRLGRTPKPIRFVQSIRLGEPSTTAPLIERLTLDPTARFKLDPTSDWTDELCQEIHTLTPDGVAVLDFKALYQGTMVDSEPNPSLYERCIRAFPNALIEDPHVCEPIDLILADHRDRVSWDAPIHSVDDLLALTEMPKAVNVKPCRFGSLKALCDFYDFCDRHGIAMYGGGFFELGVGRGQLQYLASLFHPDGSNDIAPRGYHHPHPPEGLPTSPLPPPDPAEPGFRLQDADPPVTRV